jgi:hypothetical protein
MQITLESGEAAVLREVLGQYLSDLRAEIGKTEDRETRDELHQRESVLNRIVAQLGQG